MRLINTQTYEFEEFNYGDTPQYAILSHTWGVDYQEITLQDMMYGPVNEEGPGWKKLQGCCQQAQRDGLEYAWVDTCCIDKTDLAELGEAINSMFQWYAQASICYAYLADVPVDDLSTHDGSYFRMSRWFTRGWTLQELLAPKTVRFFDSDWQCIGTKGSLCTTILEVTGIPRQFLLNVSDLQDASVAQRMSWAARRETTKSEDLAYCLLGIFDVSMPMIYGEGGDQAFFRLQERILKTVREDSILAWGMTMEDTAMKSSDQVVGGKILAVAPSDFANSGHIIARGRSRPLGSFILSGGRLHFQLPLITTSSGETIGLLNCGPISDKQQAIGIPLAHTSSMATGEYTRPQGWHPVLQSISASDPEPTQVHIRNNEQEDATQVDKDFWIYEDGLFAECGLALVEVSPVSRWDKERALISTSAADVAPLDRTFLRLRQKGRDAQDFVLVISAIMGPDDDAQCSIMVCSRDTALEDLADERLRNMIQGAAAGSQGASDGSLHFRVLSEHLEHKLALLKPERMSEAPTETLDASREMQGMF